MADRTTKSLLLPRNLCFNGTLEAACEMWWELHGKINIILLYLFLQLITLSIFFLVLFE